MKQEALILAAGMLVYGAWMLTQQQQGQVIDLTGGQAAANGSGNNVVSSAVGILGNGMQSAADFIDGATMGILNLSRMNDAKPAMLDLPNVRAMLAVIRKGEGTADAAGYRRIFGGQLFSSFADHPRITVTSKNGFTSSAAGAYQFLISTWDETRKAMRLPDFSPASQDLAALGRIAARGALQDVISGNFSAAIAKMGREWASLPGSPYGQPTQTFSGAESVYLASGGQISAA